MSDLADAIEAASRAMSVDMIQIMSAGVLVMLIGTAMVSLVIWAGLRRRG